MTRQTAVVDALTGFTTTVYDAASRTTAIYNQLDQADQFKYDKADRRIASMNALGEITTTLYDADGQIFGSINPLGQLILFAADDAGRQIAQTNARGYTTTTVYDTVSRVCQRGDRSALVPDHVHVRHYGPQGRRDEPAGAHHGHHLRLPQPGASRGESPRPADEFCV